MAFEWLKTFQQEMEKPENYAEKTLAAYRLGMKAKGSISGVRIAADSQGCPASRELDQTAVYHPDDAPHLPLPDCHKGRRCGCVYRPVMTYQLETNSEANEETNEPD